MTPLTRLDKCIYNFSVQNFTELHEYSPERDSYLTTFNMAIYLYSPLKHIFQGNVPETVTYNELFEQLFDALHCGKEILKSSPLKNDKK